MRRVERHPADAMGSRKMFRLANQITLVSTQTRHPVQSNSSPRAKLITTFLKRVCLALTLHPRTLIDAQHPCFDMQQVAFGLSLASDIAALELPLR